MVIKEIEVILRKVHSRKNKFLQISIQLLYLLEIFHINRQNNLYKHILEIVVI
jgi:hypothetical protein